MMIIERIFGIIFSILQYFTSGAIGAFFPQLNDMNAYLQEHWKKYATYVLYFFVLGSVLSLLFTFCLILAYCVNSWVMAGMNIKRIEVDFDMARIEGLKWGYAPLEFSNSKIEDEIQELILTKEKANSFHNRWTDPQGERKDDNRHNHYESYDNSHSEFMDTLKNSQKEIQKLKKQLKKQSADSMRCVQRSVVDMKLHTGYAYTMTLTMVTPETHYHRLEANTPLRTIIENSTTVKPIPTPSRSYMLSTFRTIFFAPLLILGVIPETNEIEVSIYGGANRQYVPKSSLSFIELVVESCDLQILDANLLIIPGRSFIQTILARFPIASVFLTATILNGLAILSFSIGGLMYFHCRKIVDSKKNAALIDPVVEDITATPVNTIDSPLTSQKSFPLDTNSDSWSECSDPTPERA